MAKKVLIITPGSLVKVRMCGQNPCLHLFVCASLSCRIGNESSRSGLGRRDSKCIPSLLTIKQRYRTPPSCSPCVYPLWLHILQEFVKSPLYPVLIISYEMFLRVQHLLGAVNFDLVICDEGHRLKNAGAKTTSVS